MTAPQPAPQQQPPPPEEGLQHPAVDAAAVAVIAAALAGILLLPDSVGVITPVKRAALVGSYPGRQIVDALTRLGVPPATAQAVLGMTLTNNPIPQTRRSAPESDAARRAMQRQNLLRRAQYLVNAAKRSAADYRERVAKADGDGLSTRRDALLDAVRAERPYYRAHVKAQQKRNAAARALDEAAAKHGQTLGWYAVRDGRTTRACLQAGGRNFTLGRPARIGLPGLGPHAACRCKPGAPHNTTKTIYDIEPDRD